MTGHVQLDLFGEVERAEDTKTAWLARFDRPDWVAPWDTAGGMRKGDRKPGWRCPDPDCGDIEPNSYLLYANHGWDPYRPGAEPFDGRCTAVKLREAHALYDAMHGGGQ